jgi:enoyl-CoA hydratase/carnithine racemase
MKHQATVKSRSADPAPPVLAELDTPPTAVLRLNRPDRRNAVSLELYEQLVQALEAIDADERFRVVVITGEGRASRVGADLKSHGEGDLDPKIRRRYVKTGQAAYRLLQELRVPVVAAVNGHAIGAGLTRTCLIKSLCEARSRSAAALAVPSPSNLSRCVVGISG